MRRAFFFIVALLSATSSFASLPRASMLDHASEHAAATADPLPETRVWASDVLAPFERQPEAELTRALHQTYADLSTTNASGLGRFLSVDPTWESADLGKPQTWNRYSYVLNNPINNTDPDGKCGVPGACPEPGNLADKIAKRQLPSLPTAQNPLVLDPVNRPLETLANVVMIATLVSPFAGDEAAGAAASTTARGTAVVEEGAAARSSVQANKAAGDAFRDQVAAGLRAEGRQVTTEVVRKLRLGHVAWISRLRMRMAEC